MPAEDLPVLLELLDEAVLDDEPEPPTLGLVVEAEEAVEEALLPEPELLRVPEATVLLLLLVPLPELPVAKGAEPAWVESVGMTDGVPAGEVATAGWEVMTDG